MTDNTWIFHNSTTQSQEFRLFAKLPNHVRYRVWELAAYHPRIIEIREKDDCFKDIYQTFYCLPVYSYHAGKPRQPTVLQVCRESRIISIIYFQHQFGSYRRLTYLPFQLAPDLLVNHKSDIFIMGVRKMGSTLDVFRHIGYKGISTIAINVGSLNTLNRFIGSGLPDPVQGSLFSVDIWQVAQVDKVILYLKWEPSRFEVLGSKNTLSQYDFKRAISQHDIDHLIQAKNYLVLIFDHIELGLAPEVHMEEWLAIPRNGPMPIIKKFKRPKIEIRGLYHREDYEI